MRHILNFLDIQRGEITNMQPKIMHSKGNKVINKESC